MSITTVIQTHLQILANTQYKYRWLCCWGTNGFINFCLRFFIDTRRERHNSEKSFVILLCKPHPQSSAHLVVFKISIYLGRLRSEKRNSSTQWPNPQLSTWLFFKILKFSGPSLPSMTSSTLQPISCLEVYYDNGDCHILCARA